MTSPDYSRQVRTPENPQNSDVIDLVTDPESEAADNSVRMTREYMRSPQRPIPRTTSTNSSATSSGSKYTSEVFDNVGWHESIPGPSPNSSIGEEWDIFQSDFKSRDVLGDDFEETAGQSKWSFKQIQIMKEAKLLISKLNDEKRPTPSLRSRSRIVSRSGELTPQKDSSRPVEQSPKPIRSRPRSVQASLGSPSPRRSSRQTKAESADTKPAVPEREFKGQPDDNSNQIPLVVEQRGNSSYSPESETIVVSEASPYPHFIDYKKARKPHITNAKIIERIVEGSCPQTAETKTGWIYVLESPTTAKGHVKIGKTVGSCSTREKAWGNCNFPIKQVEDINMKAFDHCSIVESLIMLELYNNRKKFECQSCRGRKGTAITHTEWFEIDQHTALKHVQKWRKWIDEHQPFDEDGKLTKYWGWRVGRLSRQGADVDWSSWTDPFWLEKHVYQIRRHLERKDMQYWIVGFAMLVIVDKYDGSWRATLGLIALLVL